MKKNIIFLGYTWLIYLFFIFVKPVVVRFSRIMIGGLLRNFWNFFDCVFEGVNSILEAVSG